MKATHDSRRDGHPNESYGLQFFSNPTGTNEGKKFIGQKSVRTDEFGNRSFTFTPNTKVAVGRTVTATATRPFTLDTSEFSAAKKVAAT